MTRLTIPLAEARPAFLGALDAFRLAVGSLDDMTLLGASRCHGWSRLDCVVHVRVGLEELLAGCAAQVDDVPDTDAASYWTAWDDQAEDDPVPGILWTRRTAGAYARPTNVAEHLGMVTDGLRATVTRMPETPIAFQGCVLTSGDLLATWAVEVALHHLDLGDVDGMPGPDPTALHLARRTAGALGRPVRSVTTDTEAVLAGWGRA